MFDALMLYLIFLITPILCYLLYIVYENIIGTKGDDLFFTLSIISSIYLITKYSSYFDYEPCILKVLLLICLMKNKKYLSILVSIYLSIYFGRANNINIYIYISKYIIILLSYFILLKKYDYKIKFILILFIEIIFDIYLNNTNLIDTTMCNLCYTVLSIIISELLIKSEKIINLYGSIRNIEKDKNLRNSLFKITHEIKNPIAVCKGYLDMMNPDDSKQVNKYVPIMKQEIDRTLTLMEDFLNLTRVNINIDEIDITLLLDDLCSNIEPFLTEKNVHFMFDVEDEEVFIKGDYDRLKQVFINLIKNSMESIPKDRIGIIKLRMIKKRKNIEIIIEDNGIGMNKETLNKIGEPFYTTKQKGTGLGVKLSKEIIELHKGTIKYSSILNTGTIVKVTLPIN